MYFLQPDITYGRPNGTVSTALDWIMNWTTVELLLGHQFRAAFVLKVHHAVSAASASVHHIYVRGSKCRVAYRLMIASPIWRQKIQNTETVRQILSPDVVRHLSMAIMQFCKASLINTIRCACILQSKGQILLQAQFPAEAVLRAFARSLYIP